MLESPRIVLKKRLVFPKLIPVSSLAFWLRGGISYIPCRKRNYCFSRVHSRLENLHHYALRIGAYGLIRTLASSAMKQQKKLKNVWGGWREGERERDGWREQCTRGLLNKVCTGSPTPASNPLPLYISPFLTKKVPLFVYSLTSPYGHLSIKDSSFGFRNAKNHTFPTTIIRTPL